VKLTTRRRNIISGLCALVLVVGATTVGVKWAFGAFDDGYTVVADFAAAGQGLVEGSDVKVRGLDVGHVESIELRDGRARVTMFIADGNDIPARSSTFTIRPKTLFGEKFVDVDLGPEETSGPYLEDGDVVPPFFEDGDPMPEQVLRDDEGRALRSAGGFELERVLADAYPILRAIDPGDVQIVLDELARGGEGLGETINRSIVNGERVLDVQAAHDADTRRFIEDLADITDELAARAPDLVRGAADLNVALPVLTEDPQAVTELLRRLELTSSELASLLEDNTAFIESVYGDGQAVLDVLHGRRGQIVPLVVGLRQYLEVVGGAARIPVGDGTLMAAVKGLLGGDACTLGLCMEPPVAATGAPTPTAPGLLPVEDLVPGLLEDLDGEVSRGTEAVIDILLGPLSGPR
jgi:phospholipid/cholesterol/gamma-HCH transport system substrate-binding protein